MTVRKAIVISCVALFVAAVFTQIYADEHEYRTSPRQPEPSSGHVYLRGIHHGALVYLTRREVLLHDYGWYLTAIFFFTAAMLESRWKTIRNTIRPIPKFY